VLSKEDQARIVKVATAAWRGHTAGEIFQAMFRGKERGHRIADFVEEKTVEALEGSGTFDVKHEVSGAKRRARGMGDAWVYSEGIYNPINVKAGVYGIGGQPNMVSLAKLTAALLQHQIDSYYLLLVKFRDQDPPVSEIQLADILHHLEFLHFDSGTGQLMLRADAFAAHIDSGGQPTPLSLVETVERLVEIRREGDRRLIQTRERKLATLERKLASFDATKPIDQSGMAFG
jgi:hypothetical protein